MVDAVVLLDTFPGEAERVIHELDSLPEVAGATRVNDGVVDVAARVTGASHEEIAHFITTTLRFLHGVRTVEEVQEEESYNGGVLQAIRSLAKS